MLSGPGAEPGVMSPVSMTTVSFTISIPKRSMPRGEGPLRYSPSLLNRDPWHGHSNSPADSHHGTLQPRCGQRHHRATTSSPGADVTYACASDTVSTVVAGTSATFPSLILPPKPAGLAGWRMSHVVHAPATATSPKPHFHILERKVRRSISVFTVHHAIRSRAIPIPSRLP
jgi:hypothetical protein